MRFNFAQLSVLLNQHYSKRLFIVFWNELGISTVTTVVQIRTSYLKLRYQRKENTETKWAGTSDEHKKMINYSIAFTVWAKIRKSTI